MLSEGDAQMFAIAHPENILLREKPLPQDIFGPEPPHNWCYYFQRADLARQYKQWGQVLELWKQAGSMSSHIAYGPEYLPFIEAFANQGQWEQAVALTLKANDRTPDMSVVLCNNWLRITREAPASDAGTASWSRVREALACAGAE